MLLTLNEDCLRIICNYLETESKIAMTQTCKYLCKIVEDTYRHSKTVQITPKLWQYFYKNEQHFHKFMECIGPNVMHLILDGLNAQKLHLLENLQVPQVKIFTISLVNITDIYDSKYRIDFHFHKLIDSISDRVEEIMLQGISHEMLNLISDLKFPKLTSCEIRLQRFTSKTLQTADDEMLNSQMFPPNMTHLLLLSDTIGRNMCELSNVTELILINCYNFVPEYLTEIFLKLRLRKLVFKPFDNVSCYESELYFESIAECQTLEELGVEYHHLNELAIELPKLKKLHTLEFSAKESCFCRYKRDRFLMEIAAHFGHTMETLIFKNIRFDLKKEEYVSFLEYMKNLRTLIISESFPKNLLLQTFAKEAGRNLQEFRLIRAPEMSDNIDEGLKDILTHCENLKIFDISFGKADVDFLKDACEIIVQSERREENPLIFRCHNTQIDASELQHIVVPNCLKVTMQHEKIKHTDLETIHCQWKPIEAETI